MTTNNREIATMKRTMCSAIGRSALACSGREAKFQALARPPSTEADLLALPAVEEVSPNPVEWGLGPALTEFVRPLVPRRDRAIETVTLTSILQPPIYSTPHAERLIYQVRTEVLVANASASTPVSCRIRTNRLQSGVLSLVSWAM